ncbi:MAG: hypothetical protein FJZ00_00585 [Candidatus Sericytochromatia bacterium]|uniref:Uncharacterized protein n=1 Tax=Candidatus Tanganyikabacteria bacterium TaxID=2961651 RepID=A0A938BHQ1_9BACT|nr:hypothetical protein [Candidatus Tanganyikabacteria bacterium]
MRGLYDLSGVPLESFAFDKPYMVVGVIGCVFWAIAYVLAIRMNHVQKTYSLPAAAVCLNIGWETLTAFVFPDPLPLFQWFFVAWFLLDVVIVYQLFRFGPGEQPDPEVARRFHAFLAGGILLGLVGQWAFVAQYRDAFGFVAGFFINVLMSASFIFFYFARRHTLRGISAGIAWTKMLGTMCTGYEAYFLLRVIDPSLQGRIAFFEFLWVAIALLDLYYVYLVTARPGAGTPASAAPEARSA